MSGKFVRDAPLPLCVPENVPPVMVPESVGPAERTTDPDPVDVVVPVPPDKTPSAVVSVRVVAFKVTMFAREDTLSVKMLAVPGTVSESRLALMALRVATFSMDDTLSVKMLAVPDMVTVDR